MSDSLLQRIRDKISDMPVAERRVAEIVNAAPHDVIHMSIATLASQCAVSDPTIIRFCRRFGFEGYQDFKLNLAQSLVPTAPFQYDQITNVDSVSDIVRKTCQNSLNAVQRTLEDLDPTQIESGIRLISQADWISLYATGISEITAIDAEHKFQRLGLRCTAIMGSKRQLSHARFTRTGDIAVIFSQSGATRQMVEIAKETKAREAKVLSITAGHSPLAQVSDVVIALTPYNHTELMTPLASRLSHHLVVNMLTTALAAISGNEFPDQLPALDFWQTEKI